MAVVDAACNKGCFEDENVLLKLEEEQIILEEKENGMFMKTMVNFHSMDSEVSV